ncbi:hypothetical protein ES703_25770 [subsurface metagenome]
MKSKFSKIMGIGFAFVLIVSMMVFALPASAGPYDDLAPVAPNAWAEFPPTPGITGGWFFDPAITRISHITEAINGDLFAYVEDATGSATSYDIFKSVDGGRTWSMSTVPSYYLGGRVVDMVCSEMSEDILYVTDGNYVWKSVNGGMSFFIVAENSLEILLLGDCGDAFTITDFPITCLDVAYNATGDSFVFIGVKYTWIGASKNYDYPSVLYINEAGYPSEWTDLNLSCFRAITGTPGGYTPYSIGTDPNFATTKKTYVAVSNSLIAHLTFGVTYTDCVATDIGEPVAGLTSTYSGILYAYDNTAKTWTVLMDTAGDVFDNTTETVEVSGGTGTGILASAAVIEGDTYIISTVGIVCGWDQVDELLWNCDAANSFDIMHASRFAFPDDFADTGCMFIGVVGAGDDDGSGNGYGGDVYSAYDTVPPAQDALDLNVQGFTSGCLGLAHANICSLDMYGGTDDGSLIAGAYDGYDVLYGGSGTNVWYSTDGGWTWSASAKDPTGVDLTYVIWYADTALAGTNGCNCAISMSCGDVVGQYWNQISLVSLGIDEVLDLTHAPGYLDGSSTMYVLTYFEGVEHPCAESTSLYRWDGTYWERVYSSLSPEYALMMEWVEASPDFNDTGCVYLANTSFQMFRTQDQGCSWRALSYPCAPLPTISAWIVVDEETVLAAGGGASSGFIWKTERHGTRPWSVVPVLNAAGAQATSDGVDFDLSPNIGTDTSVLFSNDAGQVFISQNLSASPWSEITDIVGSASFNAGVYNTYCVFDPSYGTGNPDPAGENMIYAAAGTKVGRCDLNLVDLLPSDQDWVYISTAAATCDTFALKAASGIDAAGDTALYVSDAGTSTDPSGSLTLGGTIGVRYTCLAVLCTCDLTIDATDYDDITSVTGVFQAGEPLTIIEYNLYCEVAGTILGDFWVEGILSGAIGKLITVNEDETACGPCTVPTGGVEILYSSLEVKTATATVGVDYPTGVWRTLNPMDPTPPVSPIPFVEWELLPLSAPHELKHPEAGVILANPLGVFPDDLWLTAGSNMLWALDYYVLASITDIYMWNDVLATPVIQMAPADGALLATTTTATIEWEPLDAATSYEYFIYSFCATCPDNMVLFDNDETALTCIVIEGLSPGTKYFWKVRVACNDPYVSKWSDLREFDTALSTVPYLCSPWCGQDDVILTTNYSWDPVIGAGTYEVQVVAASADGTADWTGATTLTATTNALASIPGLEYSTVYFWRVRAVSDGVYSAWAVCIFTTADQPAEPVDPVEPVDVIIQEITPLWIWVIIGIGGALTIAVVILIVSTRRVP